MNRQFDCQRVQPLLLSYLHGELAPRLRRRVAEHINTCPNCSTAYILQRDLARELERSVPALSPASRPQLNRMWANIQAEMTTSRPQRARWYRKRYGAAALILFLVLLLPWVTGGERVALARPAQPELANTVFELVVTEIPTSTPRITQASLPAAGRATPVNTGVPPLELQNTPE